MTRTEFDSAVDALVKRIDEIKFDDYYGGTSVFREFQRFVRTHADQLSYGLDDGAGWISGSFSSMKAAKNPNAKMGFFSRAIRNLRSDAESLKRHYRATNVFE